MNEVLVIEGTQIERVTYNDQPILSLPMVDAVHQRPEGTARKAFSRNREKFILGEDYYDLPYAEWSEMVGHEMPDHRGQMPDHNGTKKGHKGNMTFLTLSGYLMLVKTFTDDISWRVQRVLVQSYFELKNLKKDIETMVLQNKYVALLEDFYEIARRRMLGSGRRFTKDEKDIVKAKIAELQAEGIGVCEIGRRLGLSKGSVSNLIKTGTTSGRIVKKQE